ncbi:MAG TPA: CehA/McbA family metallohydrolase [Chloroflexota bacterium]|nr:CehA/McbA family metallohydrolase [Chloroflexota bacterium]
MWTEGRLGPSQARTSVGFPVDVPPGTGSLTIALRWAPAEVTRVKNLVTLSLFDPHGFRGAGHRHAPEQRVVVGRREATPGFVAGPLTPGTWTVELDLHAVLPSLRGGVTYQLEAVASPAAADGPEIDEEEVPDEEPVEPGRPDEPDPVAAVEPAAAPAGWLKGDLHVHSNHSDARWSIDDVVEHVRRHRLDFLALTDHNTITGRAPLRAALHAAGLNPVLIDGMELTTYWGHANALGISEWVDWRVRGPAGEGSGMTTSMEEAAWTVRERGGLFVVNHPRSAGYPFCTGCRWEYGDETAEYADAIEVMNGAWPRRQNEVGMALWDRWLNAGHRIPATAGTDSHGFARRPELLGFTYARAGRDPTDILQAVREGRTYLSRGPSVEWLDGDAPAVRVSGATGEVDVFLVTDGRRHGRRRMSGEGEMRFDLDRAWRWARVEVYAKNKKELLALTNPKFIEQR